MNLDDTDINMLKCVSSWRWEPNRIVIPTSNKEEADKILDAAADRLSMLVANLGKKLALIDFPGAKRGYEILSSLVHGGDDPVNDAAHCELVRIMASSEERTQQQSSASEEKELSNAEIERIAGADYVAIQEQMKEWRSDGLIVTVTDMMTNHCLSVNDLQAPNRRGSLKGKDWIGLNFLHLWRDSFVPGNTNYFEQLVTTVQRDKYIPNFEYNLRAPSGDLVRYVSSYYYIENYLDTPVRLCVSKVNNWEVVEEASR